MNLLQEISELKTQILNLNKLASFHGEMLEYAWLRIEELEKENAQLRSIITDSVSKPVKKNSSNSDLPPSHDLYKPKKNKSLRKKTSKKRGGQPGHKGSHLQKSIEVDEVHCLKLDSCPDCGDSIEIYKKLSTRQEIYLPEIRPHYREYQQYGCHCRNCNKTHKASYPSHINSPIQYGKDIVGLNAYLSSYQLLPYKRSSELQKDLFGLSICESTIKNQLVDFSESSSLTYEMIRSYISDSLVVGSDETSAKVDGSKKWIWTFQNSKATYLCCEDKRDGEVISKHFPNHFPNSIYVSDQYSSQLTVACKEHQLCWAHLLRKCNYLIESESSKWVRKVKQLFYQARQLKVKHKQLSSASLEYQTIQNKLKNLLIEKLSDKEKETKVFQNSLVKNKEKLFVFLKYTDVPSDNNGSERAIRNVKVKLKVSGQFVQTQHIYCRVRSIIDTCIKNGQPILNNLTNIAQGKGLLFKLT